MSKNQKRFSSLIQTSLMGGAALAVLANLPGTALAQEETGTESASTAQDEERTFDVITVQARKRTESVQEVPVTLTTVGSETLDRYNFNEVADVVSRIPSFVVVVGGSGSGGQLSLRGVGSSSISAAFDSAVALDFDGVQVSSMRLVQAGFVDTAQIDVLKGPQSLYFGKSASAGVFSVRSADPTPTWESGADASYEFEEDGYTVSGFISGPISDTLGIRVAAQYSDIDKYIEMQPGTPTANGQYRSLKNFIGRATLDWKPFDGFSANLKAQYVGLENDGAIGPHDIYCGANGVADPVVVLSGAMSIPAGYDCNAFDGKGFLPDTAAPLAGSVPLPSKAAGRNGVPFGETDIWFGRLRMNYNLTDALTLTSVSGYMNMDAADFDSYSYGGVLPDGMGGLTPFAMGQGDPVNKLDQFTQEIRLSSDFEGMFNFMLGAFYEDRQNIFDTAQNAVNISLVGPDPVTGYTYDWKKVHTTDSEAFSIFGSATLNLTDKLELSGGVRWTDESKTNHIEVPYMHSTLVALGFVPSGFTAGPINFDDNNWSPEVTVKYQATPDINVFASYKTGFKSGGIDNSALPSGSLGQAAISGDFSSLIFDSETSKGGEVGVKSQFADRRITFNATVYRYVYTDLQVQLFNPVAVQYVTTNAGEVTTQGIDTEWAWITPIDGLQLSGALAYLDTEYTDTFVSSAGVDLKGREAIQAPNWSGNIALDWLTPVTDSLELGVNGNIAYSDSYFTGLATQHDLRQDAYVTYDAAISLGQRGGGWKVSLVGVNLTDEIWINGSGGRPFLPAGGDDLALTTNRGRQIFVKASVKY